MPGKMYNLGKKGRGIRYGQQGKLKNQVPIPKEVISMESQLTAYVTLVCISGILNLYLGLNVFIKRPHYKSIAAFTPASFPSIVLPLLLA